MTKNEAIQRLELIVAETKKTSIRGYDYEVIARDWENYGKSRTYLKLIEYGEGTKHNIQMDYGYIDNHSGEYFPGRIDMRNDFTAGGRNAWQA